MTDVDARRFLAGETAALVRALPSSLVDLLVDALEHAAVTDSAVARTRIIESFSNPHYRSLVFTFLDQWRSRAPDISAEAVALSLMAAEQCEKAHQEGQSVELVWTGPDVGQIPLRRTEQAVLQVIESASHRLTIVSFAVYNIPHIREALVNAARKGVVINVVLETPDKLETENAYCTLKALGPAVASRCSVYLWPLDKRPRDGSGKPGLLHVKCAVADANWLLLTSANLTEYAFTVNMELGLLVTGGELPSKVANHFDRLIQNGILVSL
jgi:phosphatidylserine/phosphatidylglycerophosphate/cardiolipin synthase-like enzyme